MPIQNRRPNRSFCLALLAACMAGLGSFGAAAQGGGSNAAVEAMASRLQVLEDREAIRALLLAYGRAHDNRDYRTFADLFADNGEWVGGLGSAQGPEAIFELMDATIGHNPLPKGSGTVHLMTNEQIEIDGDSASALTNWTYITPNEKGDPGLVFVGEYHDRFVRERGVWKFLRREATGVIPIPD